MKRQAYFYMPDKSYYTPEGFILMNNLLKTEKVMLFIISGLLIAGAFAGALYMAYSEADNDLYVYLSSFFDNMSDNSNRFGIFKNSLADSFRIFLLVTVCSFFRAGAAGTLACCAVKGFAGGFTTAAFVRYYGARGLFVPLSSLLSTLIFIPVFVLFCTYSSCFALKKNERDKNTVRTFLVFALIVLIVFCLVSFMDGYVTTAFMKLLKPFIVG